MRSMCLIQSTVLTMYMEFDRSVCDCIRFREDIDKDIFELVIENYRKYDKKNEERLMAYAKAMRIGRQVERIGLDR